MPTQAPIALPSGELAFGGFVATFAADGGFVIQPRHILTVPRIGYRLDPGT